MQRRSFLQTAGFGTAGILAVPALFAQTQPVKSKTQTNSEQLHIAVNQYAANSFYQRDGKKFFEQLGEIKSVGVDGLEPTVDNAKSLAEIGNKLKDHGLEFRSVYVGGNLHDTDKAKQEMLRIRDIAEKAKELGSKMIIFNPAAKHGKNDAELMLQAENVNKLGGELASIGIVLAFHYHTTELEFAAREFHHLLCNTDPQNFALCLEQHWSYRGSGNSQLALFDHLKLYGNRIVAVHLRQSVNHVWSETFGDGDIDNTKLAAELKTLQLKTLPTPVHFVLEQAAEKGTPKTLTTDAVLRQSCEYARRVF